MNLRLATALLALGVGSAGFAAVGVPQVAAAPAASRPCAADEGDLARYVDVRRNEGFETDMDYVRRVSCPGDVPLDGSIGIPVTADERAELDRRNTVGETFSAITEQELSAAGDRFAGIWMDDAAGGVVVVAYRGDGSDRLSDVTRLLPPDTEVRLTQGRVSQARLDEIYRSYLGAVQGLRADGVHTLSALGDIIHGTYTIYIGSDSVEDAEERIAAAVGGWEGLVVKRDDGGSVDFMNARDTPTGRSYGGTSIGRVQGSTFWTCSSSPSARSAAQLIT